jgi:hypothetical protein
MHNGMMYISSIHVSDTPLETVPSLNLTHSYLTSYDRLESCLTFDDSSSMMMFLTSFCNNR